MNREFMQEAIRLAQEAVRSGRGGPFGAVIVKDGAIIGRGANQVLAANDPTAHAEVVAIREACLRLGSFHLSGAEIYTSCEPCPMCLAATYWARLERVYYSLTREDATAMGFDDAFFYSELSRPISERRLPMVQTACEDARETMRAWIIKPDKTSY